MSKQRFGALSKIPGYYVSAFYKFLPEDRESIPLYVVLQEFAQSPLLAALKSTLNMKLGQTVAADSKTFETNTWVLATEFGKAKGRGEAVVIIK